MRVSPDLHQRLLAVTGHALFATDRDGVVVFANPASEAILGAELIGKSLCALAHHGACAGLCAQAGATPDSRTFRLELEGPTWGVSALRYELVGQALPDTQGLHGEPGNIAGWAVEVRRRPGDNGESIATEDRFLHELERSEAMLREQQAMLQMASTVGRMGAWRVELPSLVHRWSAEAYTVIGAELGMDLSRKAVHLLFVEDDRPLMKDAFDTCRDLGRPFDHEVRLDRLDGRRIWVRVIGRAVQNADGVITAVQGAIQDIDEVTRLRHEAHAMASRLVSTLESMTDAFMTLDTQWCVTFMNRGAERLMSAPRANLLGQDLRVLSPGLEETVAGSRIRDVLQTGIDAHFEVQSERLGGKWLEVTAYATVDGLAIFMRDIEELWSSREALRLSEERFVLFSRATNEAIWDWDLTSNRLVWNEGFESLFGFSLDTLQPTIRSWSDNVHPDDREQVIRSVQALQESTKTSWSSEYRFRHQSGHYVDVIDRGHVIRDPSGRAVRMVGGMSDITERKRAVEQLREQAALLERAQDAIIVRGLDHRIKYWNESASRLYGWSSDEVLGASIETLLYDEPGAFRQATARVLEEGEWVGEIEQTTRHGRRVVVEGRWSLVRDDAGRPKSVLAINTDITERKRLEQQFLRAQRLESIGTLAGGIAHDLNNMLTPIVMTSSILLNDPSAAAHADDLRSIQNCAERGAEMVRQLLIFARGSDGRRVRVGLRAIAADTHKMVRETFPKNIDVQFVAPDDIWDVQADTTQMHQLLTNLCVNARDAMTRGGHLTIALENTEIDEVYTGMNLEAHPGPYVLLRVEDTGEGMHADVLDRIFEPFYTTKEVGKGTGLGLSTVHAIVRGHRGFIHVYSEPTKGSRFKVYIPAADPVSDVERAKAEQVPLPRGNGELILVVDDEELIRNVATRMLERYGYRVVTAPNGAEAVAIYVQMKGRIALVLTDMSMPVMDGPSTIIALRSIDPDVRIIGSSGLNANGNVAKALDAGVQTFVPKPYTAEAMLRIIRRVLSES